MFVCSTKMIKGSSSKARLSFRTPPPKKKKKEKRRSSKTLMHECYFCIISTMISGDLILFTPFLFENILGLPKKYPALTYYSSVQGYNF
ncbi:hypothetical protein EUGRSUZ_H00621 [Eucalyptus grandis]|uniref:Uncharacterized protein n=2 Tax=Eucalyptus grandis TaxID=71139 RepID=A0ACC3JLT9_EUCGR|nr:hypothetical protein EUGRSUZ_H00621 [Eucalyptus grandis]